MCELTGVDSFGDGEHDGKDDRQIEFEDDLEILRGYSLVSASMQAGDCQMHALVQFCARGWLSDDEKSWKSIFLRNISWDYPAVSFENLSKCRKLYPHVIPLIDDDPAEGDALNWSRLLSKVAQYRSFLGEYIGAEKILREALNVRERILGTLHQDTLQNVQYLALELCHQEKYKESEQMFRRNIESIHKRLIKQTFPSAAYNVEGIGSQDKYEEAKGVNRQVPNTPMKSIRAEFITMLLYISSLAPLLVVQGMNREAEMILRQCIYHFEKLLGGGNSYTTSCICFLVIALTSQKKNEEAEQIHQRYVNSLERRFGKGNLAILQCNSAFVLALVEQGKYMQAQEVQQQLVDVLEKKYGKEHLEALTGVRQLADICQGTMQLTEADRLYQRAYPGLVKILGAGHPHTIHCENQRAKLLKIKMATGSPCV